MLDNLGSDTKNPKAMSLHLFGKKGLIKLKYDTESFDKFGPEVKGILTGRVWGESQPAISDSINRRQEETVVAIYLKTDNEEITIPCSDIDEIIDL